MFARKESKYKQTTRNLMLAVALLLVTTSVLTSAFSWVPPSVLELRRGDLSDTLLLPDYLASGGPQYAVRGNFEYSLLLMDTAKMKSVTPSGSVNLNGLDYRHGVVNDSLSLPDYPAGDLPQFAVRGDFK